MRREVLGVPASLALARHGRPAPAPPAAGAEQRRGPGGPGGGPGAGGLSGELRAGGRHGGPLHAPQRHPQLHRLRRRRGDPRGRPCRGLALRRWVRGRCSGLLAASTSQGAGRGTNPAAEGPGQAPSTLRRLCHSCAWHSRRGRPGRATEAQPRLLSRHRHKPSCCWCESCWPPQSEPHSNSPQGQTLTSPAGCVKEVQAQDPRSGTRVSFP